MSDVPRSAGWRRHRSLGAHVVEPGRQRRAQRRSEPAPTHARPSAHGAPSQGIVSPVVPTGTHARTASSSAKPHWVRGPHGLAVSKAQPTVTAHTGIQGRSEVSPRASTQFVPSGHVVERAQQVAAHVCSTHSRPAVHSSDTRHGSWRRPAPAGTHSETSRVAKARHARAPAGDGFAASAPPSSGEGGVHAKGSSGLHALTSPQAAR